MPRTETNREDEGEGDGSTTVAIEDTARPRRRGGDNDLVGRALVGRARDTLSKLNLIISISDSVPENKSELTEAARSFYNSSLVPVVNCFLNHFNGDKVLFVAKCVGFSHSTFKRKCNGAIDDCKYK
jgi:hypothetical protein